MSKVKIIDTPLFFLEELPEIPVVLEKSDYELRMDKLVERINETGYSYVIIYGDREHTANIEYFTGFDPRFEEALLIVSKDGDKYIIVGNEGIDYCEVTPLDIDKILYQNFSLQGQPREDHISLKNILRSIGLTKSHKVGVVGLKYFRPEDFSNPEKTFDIPAYILDEIVETVELENVFNFTEEITGLPNGVRMRVRTAKEIAYIEYMATKCTNVVLRILKGLKPGMNELEATKNGEMDFSPQTTHPLTTFGSSGVALGMRSPRHDSFLEAGNVGNVCYSLRQTLVSRTGVFAFSADDYKGELKGKLEEFYMPYFSDCITTWYETMKVGAIGGDVYDTIDKAFDFKKFGVKLNPGHNICIDEWSNTPNFPGSQIPIHNGTHMQCDIIATSSNPVMTGICEDTVVIADENLRKSLSEEFPKIYQRIIKRQERMRQDLNIDISDDVLPMSNLNGAYFPFMLNLNKVMANVK